jgi:hypothetical protein
MIATSCVCYIVAYTHLLCIFATLLLIHLFVVLLCLRSHETTTYVRMIEKLQSYMQERGLVWRPTACMCDFERGFISALKELRIDMRGCKFHLLQAIKRKLVKYDVEASRHASVIECVRICFHAQTPDEFKTALVDLDVKANNPQFTTYFRSTWVGNDYELASRWAFAYQSTYISFNPK